MTESAAPETSRKLYRWILWAGLLIVVAANAHLVYVAVKSQPECVTHVRSDVAPAKNGMFAAAKSAC